MLEIWDVEKRKMGSGFFTPSFIITVSNWLTSRPNRSKDRRWTHTHMHAHLHTHVHACTHTLTCMHACIRAHAHARIPTCLHTYDTCTSFSAVWKREAEQTHARAALPSACCVPCLLLAQRRSMPLEDHEINLWIPSIISSSFLLHPYHKRHMLEKSMGME
jgi:hypothetical protein